MSFEQIFQFRKYNWSNNGPIADNNPESDKEVRKYIYGDNIANIDNNISAKNWEIYISTRKSDYYPTIYIYLDQNSNRNYHKDELFAKIENIKKYLSQIAKLKLIEFWTLDKTNIYMSNLQAITKHIRNREADLPVVIISDRLTLDEKIAADINHIYSLTDIFCFKVWLPDNAKDYYKFYLSEDDLALAAEIYDL